MKKLILTSGLFLLLTACSSINNTIGGVSLAVQKVADIVYAECQNTEPGGPCVEGSLIDTGQKNRVARQLDHVMTYVESAAELADAGDNNAAATTLQRADALLTELERQLSLLGLDQ